KRTLSGHNGAVTCVAARGSRAVSAGADGTLRVWDLDGVAEPRALEGVRAPSTVSLSEKGDKVLLGGASTLALRDLESSELLRKYDTFVAGAALSPDGSRALVAITEGVVVWDFDLPTPIALS